MRNTYRVLLACWITRFEPISDTITRNNDRMFDRYEAVTRINPDLMRADFLEER